MSTIEDYQRRYLAAMHAVQTGVAWELHYDATSGTPKHLRTGVNMAMVDHGALVQLLIAKGVLTKEEYWKAIAEGAEAEQRSYEQRLTEISGSNVRLG